MKQYGSRLIALLCLMLASVAGSALAQDELPQGAKTLMEQVYPTHEIAMVSGSGDDVQGAFAVVLSYIQDEREWQIICTVEKSQSDSTYVLTTENGSTLPIAFKILDVEMKGDQLMITCKSQMGMEESNCYTYRTELGGAWILVKGDRQQENTQFVGGEKSQVVDSSRLTIHDDHLQYQYSFYGEAVAYPPVPYGEGFKQYFLLANFDGSFPLTPYQFNMSVYQKLIDTPLVNAGETLGQADLQVEDLILIVELADGMVQMKIYPWNKETLSFQEPQLTRPTAVELYLDTFHFGNGELGFHIPRGMDASCSFAKTTSGNWCIKNIQAKEIIGFGSNYIRDLSDGYRGLASNDGCVYGVHPWSDLLLVDFETLPETLEEAMAQLDTSNYAYVNNPKPEDRLNIRTEPNSDAATRGKLYSRTPVYVKEILGDWVHIAVGSMDGLDGYVMKKFLAFGDEKDAVKCAFPQMSLKEEIQQQLLYAKPSEKAEVVSTAINSGYFVVGVYGDDWYIILTSEGVVGYAPQASYWAGNG